MNAAWIVNVKIAAESGLIPESAIKINQGKISGGHEVTVSGGVSRLRDGTLASSTVTMNEALNNAVDIGIPMKTRSRWRPAPPAEILGLSSKGRISAGCDADLVLVDEDFNVSRTMIEGRMWQKPSAERNSGMRNFDGRNGKFGVGVDIGGTKTLVCVLSAAGEVIYRDKAETVTDFSAIRDRIAECLDAASVPMEQVSAIGFGVPGVTDTRRGVVLRAPALGWRDVPFRSGMQRYFRAPVTVNNDANNAALGELWLGSAQDLSDFVFIDLGTGVGSALVANGQLVEGAGFMAGEIGYFVSEQDIAGGYTGSLDHFGAFELKTSGTALSRYGCAAEELFVKYHEGDPGAVAAIDRFASELSIGIANIVSLLNPSKVIIGGGVSRSLPAVIEGIRSRVARWTPLPAEIELSRLGEDAGAIGAFAYALQSISRSSASPVL